jgi:hypothetical protein
MHRKRILIILLILGMFPFIGCKSKSHDTSTESRPESPDPLAEEGRSRAMDKLSPFVLKCGSNYFFKKSVENSEVMRGTIDVVYELIGEACSFIYTVSPLKESDKLNGWELRAKLQFSCKGPTRIWHPQKGWQLWTEKGLDVSIGVGKISGTWSLSEAFDLGYKKLSCEEIYRIQLPVKKAARPKR